MNRHTKNFESSEMRFYFFFEPKLELFGNENYLETQN